MNLPDFNMDDPDYFETHDDSQDLCLTCELCGTDDCQDSTGYDECPIWIEMYQRAMR